MATTFTHLFGTQLVRGLVAGTHWSGHLPQQLEWQAAGHPLPNGQSLSAGLRALELARGVPADGQLVVLLTGGASALLSAPVRGLELSEKVAATQALLSAGVEIHILNCVRKHLSIIKGGWLAAVARCPVLTLAISDVVGPVEDDPAVIGSGPTVPGPTTFQQAVGVTELADVHREFPPAARAVLERGLRAELPETPKPGDPRLDRSIVHLIGSRRQAMEGAKWAASSLGYTVATIEPPVTGEARVAARHHLAHLVEAAQPLPRPACLLSSGETTVRVVGQGRGGRNQEFVLTTVRDIGVLGGTAVLASLGTDGVDGPTDAAGAIADTTTLQRAAARSLREPEAYLAGNDAYAYFEPLGDLVKTGPTDTNVGDIQIALIAEQD